MNNENHENYRIACENHVNHEHRRILCDNNENHANNIIPIENHTIIKNIEYHERVNTNHGSHTVSLEN